MWEKLPGDELYIKVRYLDHGVGKLDVQEHDIITTHLKWRLKIVCTSTVHMGLMGRADAGSTRSIGKDQVRVNVINEEGTEEAAATVINTEPELALSFKALLETR